MLGAYRDSRVHDADIYDRDVFRCNFASNSQLEDYLPVGLMLVIASVRLLPFANRILQATNQLKFGRAALDIVRAELAREEEKFVPARDPLPFRETIELRNVTFRYDGTEHDVLSDVSFAIRPGEIVGIVGASGSGKTTLANLLIALLRPSSGQILVDGQDIADRRDAWQLSVAYVPQDFFLLDASLRENIAFAIHPEAIDEARLSRAVAAASLDKVVVGLPEGLDTNVGIRGVRLSGGQRQRVAIARAVYFGRTVIVLDEATAALDAQTENEVTTAIQALHHQITVVVIAHRLSTLRSADRIYVMDQGRVDDTGTFDALLARSALFRALAAEQHVA